MKTTTTAKMKTTTTAKLTGRQLLRNWTMVAFLLPLLFLAGLAQAQTNIIYQDSFARSGQLNGTSPDVVNTGSAVWYACTNVSGNNAVVTDGSEIAFTNAPPVGAGTGGFALQGFLPLTPVGGHRYTLTASILGLAGANQWLALGYSLNEATNNYFAGATIGTAWLLQRASGANIQTFMGPGTTLATTYNLPGSTVSNTYSIVLDTTTVNATAGWTVTWFANGIQVNQGVYTTGNP